jgi:hypothetical protein
VACARLITELFDGLLGFADFRLALFFGEPLKTISNLHKTPRVALQDFQVVLRSQAIAILDGLLLFGLQGRLFLSLSLQLAFLKGLQLFGEPLLTLAIGLVRSGSHTLGVAIRGWYLAVVYIALIIRPFVDTLFCVRRIETDQESKDNAKQCVPMA